MITVTQGSFKVTNNADDVMTTVLGSCIATCLYDPVVRVGGMNHFLLPDQGGGGNSSILYGTQAMELLINGLLKLGARKTHLQAKLFGGASVLSDFSDIGDTNAKFAARFLKEEGIDCVSISVGGTQARRVRFWPTTGRAVQRRFAEACTIPIAPVEKAKKPNITLF